MPTAAAANSASTNQTSTAPCQHNSPYSLTRKPLPIGHASPALASAARPSPNQAATTATASTRTASRAPGLGVIAVPTNAAPTRNTAPTPTAMPKGHRSSNTRVDPPSTPDVTAVALLTDLCHEVRGRGPV